MAINSLTFLISYSVFIFFVIYVTGLMGISGVVTGAEGISDIPVPICALTGLSALLCAFSNLGYFFSLMTVSSGYAVLGSILFAPLLIGLIWIVLQMIRGTGD